MAARNARGSVRPSFDPVLDGGGVELVPDGSPPRRLGTVAVRYDDKQAFDELQAWFLYRHGRRLRQWELFSVVLADALSNREGQCWGSGRR